MTFLKSAKLPSEAILKMYRALGLREFAGACGWEPSNIHGFFKVPVDQFKTLGELRDFCLGYDLHTNLSTLGFKTTLAEHYPNSDDGCFHLLLEEPQK